MSDLTQLHQHGTQHSHQQQHKQHIIQHQQGQFIAQSHQQGLPNQSSSQSSLSSHFSPPPQSSSSQQHQQHTVHVHPTDDHHRQHSNDEGNYLYPAPNQQFSDYTDNGQFYTSYGYTDNPPPHSQTRNLPLAPKHQQIQGSSLQSHHPMQNTHQIPTQAHAQHAPMAQNSHLSHIPYGQQHVASAVEGMNGGASLFYDLVGSAMPQSGQANNMQLIQQQNLLGQSAPPGMKPKVTTTLWEDEGTLCFQVESKGICVARREDNDFINGTKLLNVAGMTRGRRDGILKSEKNRHVVKIGAMHLKGVWIPFDRALNFAQQENITDHLYPLFVEDIKSFLYHPANYARTTAVMAAAQRRQQSLQYTGPPPYGHFNPGLSGGGHQHRPGIERSISFPTPPSSASSILSLTGGEGNANAYWPQEEIVPVSNGPEFTTPQRSEFTTPQRRLQLHQRSLSYRETPPSRSLYQLVASERLQYPPEHQQHPAHNLQELQTLQEARNVQEPHTSKEAPNLQGSKVQKYKFDAPEDQHGNPHHRLLSAESVYSHAGLGLSIPEFPSEVEMPMPPDFSDHPHRPHVFDHEETSDEEDGSVEEEQS